MNRSIVLVGIGIFLLAVGLMAFPIATTGAEQFDLEQQAGIYVIPPALAVILLGAVSIDPRGTTIGGAFGNPDARYDRLASERPAPAASAGLLYNPNEAARCRYCSAIVAPELSQCPRCARARECRTCNRPLGTVLERATCPTCAMPEARCRCGRIPLRAVASAGRARRA